MLEKVFEKVGPIKQRSVGRYCSENRADGWNGEGGSSTDGETGITARRRLKQSNSQYFSELKKRLQDSFES